MEQPLTTIVLTIFGVLSSATVCRYAAANEDCCGPNDPNGDSAFCAHLATLSDTEQTVIRTMLGDECNESPELDGFFERYVRKPNFIRFGRTDPWSETRPNFLRFGRSSASNLLSASPSSQHQYLRMTRSTEEDRRPNFIRFGKKMSPFERSDRKPNIIRFGRSVNPKFQPFDRKEPFQAATK